MKMLFRVPHDRSSASRSPVSDRSETENMMSETREDLLQGKIQIQKMNFLFTDRNGVNKNSFADKSVILTGPP